MTEADHEILEHLVHVRSALDAMRDDIYELKRPLGALENRYLSISVQLDRINFRIERIERRLDRAHA